jgi:oxalate decarboxylase
MTDLLRRKFMLEAATAAAALGAATTAGAASFGNPDSPPEGRINAKSRSSLTDPGPQNPELAKQFPSFQDAPATDINGMPQFWASFNNVHKRIQDGGWARQVTQFDFQISEDIAGVNMRLARNGIRELHWHQQAEWAIMLNGECRVTVLDEEARPQVADVRSGDLWYFPPGLPHSLQGLGPDGGEFLIAFDNGKSTEFDTLMVTDWTTRASSPPRSARRSPKRARRRIRSCSRPATGRPRARTRPGRSRSWTAATSMFRRRSPPQWSRSSPVPCASCTGIRTRMNGSTTSRARRG